MIIAPDHSLFGVAIPIEIAVIFSITAIIKDIRLPDHESVWIIQTELTFIKVEDS
jgi:hypothetical protein